MSRIGIIDLGIGNINSVQKALTALRIDSIVSADFSVLRTLDKLILPGVGSFAAASHALDVDERRPMLTELMHDKPLLGICVGMQLLATTGLEHGANPGLGVVPGSVDMLSTTQPLPHVGWNRVCVDQSSPLFANIPDGSYFYFTHSYAFTVEQQQHRLASTFYGVTFSSAVVNQRIYGVQFHPEKSQQFGLQLLRNFVELG